MTSAAATRGERRIAATCLPPASIARHYRETGAWTDRSLPELYADAVARFGDRPALIDGATRLTFARLDAAAERVAAALRVASVGPGEVVSFQLPNRWETVAVFLGIVKVGAVANPIVPIYRGRELGFILGQARTRVAFAPRTHRGVDFADLYAGLRDDLPELELLVLLDDPTRPGEPVESSPGTVGWEDFLAAGSGADAAEPVSAGVDRAAGDALSLLLYTSGTTANPKGVLHTHNTLVFDARQVAQTYGLAENDVIFNPSPLSHVTGVCAAMVIPMLTGSAVVVQDAWDPDRALRHIIDEGATFMVFSTPFLAGLVDSATRSGPPTTIRNIVCGGADVPDALTRRATDLLGTVTRMYGLSESPSATGSTDADSIDLRVLTDGKALPDTQIRIQPIDDEEGRVAADPTGRVIGEVLVRGPDTMVGYLDASLNADAVDASGWLHTGDIGYLDDSGALHICGRIKDVINRSGEKISAHDVENQLAELPGVVDVAVVGGPDQATGERVCAFLVLDGTGPPPGLVNIGTFLTDRGLARQKIPETLLRIDALPRNASGKVQKFALRAWLTDPTATQSPLAGRTIEIIEERSAGR